MNASWMRRRWRWARAAAAAGTLAASAPAASVAATHQATHQAAGGPGYQATIVRTTYGIPHITADSFTSLGYAYGYAFASDNLLFRDFWERALALPAGPWSHPFRAADRSVRRPG